MGRHCLYLGTLVFAFCLGCSQSPSADQTAETADEHDHDHAGHDHEHEHGDHHAAESYDEAVEMVESARDTIRDSLSAGDKNKADEALHDLGHVLEQIPELAKSHSSEASEAVKQDVDELFNLFGKLDEQIHAHAEVTYDEYSEKIDAAIERLHERTDHHHAEGKEE